VSSDNKPVSAIVLAAGLSSRMGVQKLLLPWQGTTVIGAVVDTLKKAGIDEVIVVTGRDANLVDAEMSRRQVSAVFNPLFANGSMLDSLKTGMAALSESSKAFLLVLGDQPQMEAETVLAVVKVWQDKPEQLCIPSWQMRRGHPWMVPMNYWQEIQGMPAESTLRELLSAHTADIQYVVVESATIMADLDTREAYDAAVKSQHPRARKEEKD